MILIVIIIILIIIILIIIISQSKHSSNRKEKKSSNRINDKLIDEDDINAIRPNQIKKEIDNLDEEIFKLQTQLKKMLNK